MEWLQLKILVQDESLKEAISNYLFELGSSGVSETVDKGVSQGLCACFTKDQQPEIERNLKLYLESLKELFPDASQVQWNFEPVAQDNWAEKYKEFYQAQKLTERFFLRPRWDEQTLIPRDKFPILLDPGQAFGTGLHQSTRLSLKLMEDVASLFPSLGALKLLDVGTGTGILSIAAAHLGFGEIVAIDNDEDAVRVAAENLTFNNSQRVKISGTLISEIPPCFDVIVSNILLETHLLLAKDYQRLLKEGGILILAGLLGGQVRQLENVLTPLGFVAQQKYLLQEWAAYSYTFRRRP